MFLVTIHRSGPEWDPAKPLEEQSGWDEHARFMDALVGEGFIVLGGPLGDEVRVAHAVEAESEEAIRAKLARGPLERVAPGDRRDRSLDDPARRSLARVSQHERGDLARAPRRLAVALAGGDDRALHEDVPLVREPLGVGDAGLAPRARPRSARMRASWSALARCTGLPGSAVSSSTLMNEQPSKSSRRNHSSKTSKIASSRSAGSAARRSASLLEPVLGPALLAALEEREHELVLGAEVAIQRHPRDAGAAG